MASIFDQDLYHLKDFMHKIKQTLISLFRIVKFSNAQQVYPTFHVYDRSVLFISMPINIAHFSPHVIF